MPPRCYVCGIGIDDVPDDGREHFTLIYFGATEEAKLADARATAVLGWTGHPRNAVWFCDGHVGLAREHEVLDVQAALAAVDAAVGREQVPRPVEGGAPPSTR